MHFRIAEEVFRRFPAVCIGLVVAQGVANDRDAPRIATLLRDAERETARRFADRGIRGEPAFAAWRSALTVLGSNPSRYRSSVEALAMRVLKEDPLPERTPAENLANAVSLTYRLPVGSFDLARCSGDLIVGPARPGARFTPVGQERDEEVAAGEFVYADDQEVHTRRWVWRQSEHSRIVPASRTILFALDGWLGQTDVAVHAAQGDLVRYLEEDLGAQTRSFFLDREHPSAHILEAAALPDRIVTTDGGFRMAGLGYLERPAMAPPREAPARPGRARQDVEGARGDDQIGILLSRATVDVVVREELEQRLRRGDRLRVKLGVDPTNPHLHLGHAVVLRKVRAFQDLGHTVCMVIGDFTAQIGDASDKTAARPILSEEAIYENMAAYKRQIARILDERSVEWSYNNDWLAPLRFRDVAGLAAHFTVAEMLERETFAERYAGGRPIGLHELLYPLMQGYDSVALRADVEIGGTDQRFNLLAGRTIQRSFGQAPQAVITCALLLSPDGRKMSTTLGNTIVLEDAPAEFYGKLMRIADEQIVPYFELCTDLPAPELQAIDAAIRAGEDPLAFKKRLAHEVTRLHHGAGAARMAEGWFEREVHAGDTVAAPSMPDMELAYNGEWPLVGLLCALGLARSTGEARRKLEEGAVRVDDAVIADPTAQVVVRDGMIVRLGKRRYRKVHLPS